MPSFATAAAFIGKYIEYMMSAKASQYTLNMSSFFNASFVKSGLLLHTCIQCRTAAQWKINSTRWMTGFALHYMPFILQCVCCTPHICILGKWLFCFWVAMTVSFIGLQALFSNVLLLFHSDECAWWISICCYETELFGYSVLYMCVSDISNMLSGFGHAEGGCQNSDWCAGRFSYTVPKLDCWLFLSTHVNCWFN